MSVILIAVAPRRPWHMLSPIAGWKQLMFSGTSIISAIIAKLCWTSFISSSKILKNVCISNDILLAGIVMLIVPLEKSVPDEQKHRNFHPNLFHMLFGQLWTLILSKNRSRDSQNGSYTAKMEGLFLLLGGCISFICGVLVVAT